MDRLEEAPLMLPVTPADEPDDFDDRVRRPGLLAISERIGTPPPEPRTAGRPCERAVDTEDRPIERPEHLRRAHFPPYWTRAIDDLMAAYRRICSYSCFAIHPVTGAASVDHMVPVSHDWQRVYEWSNYRLAAKDLNARKGDFVDVLDPFDVAAGWFRMDFVRFELHPGPGVDPGVGERIRDTIARLRLNTRKLRERRRLDYVRYREGRVDFPTLVEESPLVAREVVGAGLLRASDQQFATEPSVDRTTPQDA